MIASPGRIEARRVGAPEALWRYDGEEVDLNRPPPVAFANEASRRFLLVEPGTALHIFDLLRGPLCTIALADRVRVRQERLVDRPFFAPDERSLVYLLDGALQRLDLEGCASRNLAVAALPEPEGEYNPPQCHCLLGAKNGEFAWTDSRYAADGLRPASRVARLWHIGADRAELLLELHPAPAGNWGCESLRALDLWGPIEKAAGE